MGLKKIATRNVATITADSTIQEAAKVMRELHVGDLVVAEKKNGKNIPSGILTDRDIVLSTVAFGLDPKVVLVGDLMGPALAIAKTNDSFYHVLNLMKEHGIKRVPLVNEAGALEGIVSSDDLVALLASELSDVARIQERQHKIECERRRKFG